MERICKTPHEYAGRQLVAGDRFDVEPDHVEVLLALDRIEPEEGEVVPCYASGGTVAMAPGTYATRAMSASREKRGQNRKAI